MADLICAAPGCGRPRKNNGYCWTHYTRLRRHGDLDAVKKVPFGAQRWLCDHIDHAGAECLIWPFARSGAGYGVVEFRGRQTSAQYAMCTLAHGEPPTPQHQAAHSCGRGAAGCANPKHLRWAAPRENMADQLIHGTRVRGEKQGSSKLTEADVRSIRQRARRELQKEIAADYGVGQAQISRVVSGTQWGWLT